MPIHYIRFDVHCTFTGDSRAGAERVGIDRVHHVGVEPVASPTNVADQREDVRQPQVYQPGSLGGRIGRDRGH